MKKILMFGGAGLVGSRFIELFSQNSEINAPDFTEVDILNRGQVFKAVEQFNPDVMINFAAFTNVEAAEEQRGDRNSVCFQVNAIGAKNIAEISKRFSKHLVHISTEYVFDGNKQSSPYTEEDKPNPINWYGQTKYFGEGLILETGCPAVIARICMPFRAFYKLKKDTARFFLDQLKQGEQIKAIENQRITPTLVDDIVYALKILIDNKSTGFYHISSTDSVTPLEFVKTIARVFKLNYALISPISFEAYNLQKKAKLLKYSWLNPAKFEKEFGGGILHTAEEGLTAFKKEIDEQAENQL